MADLFVSKRGNDSNDGLTLGNAKLTIGGAILAAVTGNEIEIRSGHYNESLGNVGGTTKSLTFTGVGQVVLDGNSVLLNALLMSGSQRRPQVFNNTEFRNYANSPFQINTGTTIAGGGSWDFNKCRLFGNVAGKDVIDDNDNQAAVIQFFDCLIVNLAAGGNGYTGSRNDPLFRRCTFETEDGDCFRGGDAVMDATILSCNFITNTGFCINLGGFAPSQVLAVSNFNSFFVRGAGNLGRFSNLNKFNLAAWQPGGSDADSIEGDPLIADRALGIYIPTTASPLLGAGSPFGSGAQEDIGAFKKGFAISNNVNNALWVAPVLVNMVLNASNRYELVVPGSGSVAPDVLDMGARFDLEELRVFGIVDPLAGANIGKVFDKSLADDDFTLEFRHSNASFLKAAGTPAYVEFKHNELVGQEAQFIQWRVTARDNGDLN